MKLTIDLKAGLNVALDEAALLGFELDPDNSLAVATLAMLALPASGSSMPADPRVQLLFRGVRRLVVSLRHGRWDDRSATVETVSVDRLADVVQSFQGLPIHGGDFFDRAERDLAEWGDRMSLDWRSPRGFEAPESLFLFQNRPDRHLDLWVWFEELEAFDPSGKAVPLTEVVAAGKRWWDAFHSHDPRTQGRGMAPLK